MPDDFWQGLCRLTRYRFKLSHNLSQARMRYQSHAFLKCSDWRSVKAFADIFRVIGAALLTEFTATELREMTHDQLADLAARRGRGRLNESAAMLRLSNRFDEAFRPDHLPLHLARSQPMSAHLIWHLPDNIC